MNVVDDATSLNGGTIDVGARIGWILRMARVTAQVDDGRMRTVAAAIGTSPARLSRAETGQLRDGSLVDGYERVLGLVEGSLRAPIDVLARTFPWVSPADARPGSPISTVRELSDLTERLDSPEDVTGSDWLRWARAISVPGNVGLPEAPAQRIVDRLVRELSRSCGHGYPARYEALAKVRCSDYGYLVLRSARREVAHPHAQGLGDLLSAVGEAATPDAVQWCLELLRADRPYVAMCGALALENMAEISPRGAFWPAVAPALIEAYDVSPPGSVHEEWVAHLIRLVPTSTWASSRHTPARPLPPAPVVEGFDRHEANRHWKQCLAIADEVTREVGVGEQPMLARLVFDIGFGHWESRAVTGYLLLGASPALAHPMWDRFGELVDAEPDHRLRHRMARRLHGALAGRMVAPAMRWIDSPDPVLREAGLRVVGSSGDLLPLDVVRRALADPETVQAAMYAIGMSGHPALPGIAADDSLPGSVRGPATWWLDRGPRVAV